MAYFYSVSAVNSCDTIKIGASRFSFALRISALVGSSRWKYERFTSPGSMSKPPLSKTARHRNLRKARDPETRDHRRTRHLHRKLTGIGSPWSKLPRKRRPVSSRVEHERGCREVGNARGAGSRLHRAEWSP